LIKLVPHVVTFVENPGIPVLCSSILSSGSLNYIPSNWHQISSNVSELNKGEFFSARTMLCCFQLASAETLFSSPFPD
jgi:hypothetical protein